MANRRQTLQLLAAGAGVLAAPGIVRAQSTKTLRMGHIFPEAHPYHQGLLKFAEEVEARTAGSVKAIIYSSGQLGGEIQMIEGMGLGSVDGGSVAAGSLAQTHGVSIYSLLDMPYLFTSYEEVESFVASDIAEEFRAALKPGGGLKILGWGGNGFSQMINRTRPVTVPADLEGLKFRVWESPSARLSFEIMGMNPTPMAYGEVFTAIQQGVVDGLVNSMTTLYQTKMYEVAKYLSISDQIYAFLFMLISEDVYNGLTSEEQVAVDAAAQEACRFWRAIYPVNDAEYRKLLDEAGAEVNEVDKVAFARHCRAQYGRYTEVVEAPGVEDLIARLVEFADAQ